MTAFRVGQRVVAIKTEQQPLEGIVVLEAPIIPEVGRVYTIREIMIGIVGGAVCVKLHEIPDQKINILANGEHRLGSVVFEASGFRPIVSRPTSIAVFQAMLTGKKAGVEA